ncbi:hypothetical protein N9N67_12260 [Bacteriovoracaceae bacterium]|nr:hypothetical protein [Bacteriovoracaceae bacterium]
MKFRHLFAPVDKEEPTLLWSDEKGDLRKQNKKKRGNNSQVDENSLEIHIRRLTSGKGRTVIHLSNLPDNDNWNKKLAKKIKAKLGVGGTYKNSVIEITGEKLAEIKIILDKEKLKYKQTGG